MRWIIDRMKALNVGRVEKRTRDGARQQALLRRRDGTRQQALPRGRLDVVHKEHMFKFVLREYCSALARHVALVVHHMEELSAAEAAEAAPCEVNGLMTEETR